MKDDFLNEEIKDEKRDIYDDDLFDEVQNDKDSPQQLGREQKYAAVFLAVFGVFIVIMWMASFKNNIISPLDSAKKNTNQTEQESSACTGPDCGQDENLRFKDTDNDGLTDYDEINIYKTSPYLEDSDSDGVSDSIEIAQEEDPNCPVGRDCYDSSLLSEDLEETEVESESLIPAETNLITPNEVTNTQEQDLNNILQGGGSADQIRQALLDFGMDANVLNQISDEELMSSYQDTLN